ncbi:hypothetical protein E2C01_011807 [Portunus trituberculatus]|uniref:Uncharacterized protein n=1 Tax=Portunus trituberculatus TaxID=210409 RepID=A0A5B7DCF5_PORTR|nr:hypothetical protein [Portunus trituberculatus]
MMIQFPAFPLVCVVKVISRCQSGVTSAFLCSKITISCHHFPMLPHHPHHHSFASQNTITKRRKSLSLPPKPSLPGVRLLHITPGFSPSLLPSLLSLALLLTSPLPHLPCPPSLVATITTTLTSLFAPPPLRGTGR